MRIPFFCSAVGPDSERRSAQASRPYTLQHPMADFAVQQPRLKIAPNRPTFEAEAAERRLQDIIIQDPSQNCAKTGYVGRAAVRASSFGAWPVRPRAAKGCREQGVRAK